MRQTYPTTVSQDTVRDETPAAQPPCCPVCSGPLVELRGQFRCTRCFYTMCVGCESSSALEYCAMQND